MKRALMGASAAAALGLAPLCIPPAEAHADDPCVSITDPAAHQACVDESLPDHPTDRPRMGECQASPSYGAEGQFCRNFWIRKSAPRATTTELTAGIGHTTPAMAMRYQIAAADRDALNRSAAIGVDAMITCK